MIKSLTALAIFGLLGAAVVVLPGFAPQVEASETVALAKGDRLDIRPVAEIVRNRFGPTSKRLVCATRVRSDDSRSSFGHLASLKNYLRKKAHGQYGT